MKEKILSLFYYPERNQTADLLKGFAVLLMIQVHITENFLKLNLHEETFGVVSFFLGGTPAAPVFMMVMGYFLSVKKNLMYYIERGTILFLGGILLNIGLNFYYLILYFQNQIIDENPLKYIFGVDILPFAGLSLIIIGLLKEVFNDKFYFYLLTALLIAFISDYLPTLPDNSNPWLQYIFSFVYGCSEWSYFPLFPWLFYPLVGFSFKLISEKSSIKNVNQIVIVALVIVLSFAYPSFHKVIVLDDYYHHGIMLAVWNSAFIIVWLFLINKLENYFGKTSLLIYIKWIGKNVTPVYVFQWLLIGNLAILFYDSQNELQFFFWFFIVLFLSSLFTFYYEKKRIKKLSVQTNE
jgi:hypothetical protein